MDRLTPSTVGNPNGPVPQSAAADASRNSVQHLPTLAPERRLWGLRRAAELFGDHIAALPDVVPNAVEKCLSARDVAVLLEGLERADHSWTAREYVPIIERHRHRDLALMSWSMFVCAKKLTGLEFSNDGQGQFAEIERRVRECSDELPRRCSVYCDRATDALGVERLVNYILGATLDDAVRLLEAGGAISTPIGRSASANR